jgi:hypothetical protein
MKKFPLFGAALLLLTACQPAPKQYSETGPEIDLARKNLAAYVSLDWEAYASTYADTAKIQNNSWNPANDQNVTQWIEGAKNFRAQVPNITIARESYSYIIEDDGDEWVLSWFEWTGRTIEGKEVTIPIHMSSKFGGGKIVAQELYYDFFQVSRVMPADSAQAPQP